jgi:hypothetical protein
MIEVFQKFQMPLMGLRAFKYLSHILPLLSLSKRLKKISIKDKKI